jgi:hypothetical protein
MVPVLLVFVLQQIWKAVTLKVQISSKAMYFCVFLAYFSLLDCSPGARFMLGLHIFMLAWGLARLFRYLDNSRPVFFANVGGPLIVIIVIGAVCSYLPAIDGDRLHPRLQGIHPSSYSILNYQYKVYPRKVSPEAFYARIRQQWDELIKQQKVRVP